MKVKVLDHKCQGHSMCALFCPEIFELSDEDGHARVLSDTVPPELESQVLDAKRSCPEEAIEIY